MTVLRLVGVTLPDGLARELFVLDGRITFTRPAAEVRTIVDGGWLLPGLVDMHAHPGLSHGDAEDPFRAACADLLDQGVTAARVPGLPVPLPPDADTDPELPTLTVAETWLLHSSLGEGMSLHRHVDDLGAAAAAAARPGGWVKIIGDWEPDADPAPLDQVRAAVLAAHAAGARVAVHCQTAAGCAVAVAAGVDSLEHGMHLDHALLPTMAAQGTAFVPTIATFADEAERVRSKPAGPRRDWYLNGLDGLAPSVAAAVEAGVRVFAGTDSPPRSGLADEIGHLHRAGLSTADAIGAASWAARDWLGWQGLVEGAPADLVALDTDPRLDLAALRHPRLVLLRGRIVRSQAVS
ncbi:amidohydrolase family protein [Solihabitans fulvus]|uniref:Amidohydrolase family protein n=1 Tax=Solihabitans fulvus TaxID=1892852 RepID=A0A5B2XS03_9PSEU|nr:amidohydrolase family protein [Solihabitans fulvus]KAA2266166.1 amidohydrolase family protein [Solihabitans fulvus]